MAQEQTSGLRVLLAHRRRLDLFVSRLHHCGGGIPHHMSRVVLQGTNAQCVDTCAVFKATSQEA